MNSAVVDLFMHLHYIAFPWPAACISRGGMAILGPRVRFIYLSALGTEGQDKEDDLKFTSAAQGPSEPQIAPLINLVLS